jgi:hypothetical protein
MTTPQISERLDAVLGGARNGAPAMSVREVESRYTEGCAEALSLEVEALVTKRRLAATRLEAGCDADAERELRALAAHWRLVSEELSLLRERLGHVRAVLERLHSEGNGGGRRNGRP